MVGSTRRTPGPKVRYETAESRTRAAVSGVQPSRAPRLSVVHRAHEAFSVLELAEPKSTKPVEGALDMLGRQSARPIAVPVISGLQYRQMLLVRGGERHRGPWDGAQHLGQIDLNLPLRLNETS